MASPDFILLGDSHAGAIGTAARNAKLRFAGGPLGSGREFYLSFHDASDGQIRFQSEDMQERYQQICGLLDQDNILSSDLPILCTIGSGFHVAATTSLWGSFINPQVDIDAGLLQSALFMDLCAGLFAPTRAFYQKLRKAGRVVQFALPPQRCPETSDIRIMRAFQSRAVSQLQDLGCGIIDTRATTAIGDQQRAEFCKANDPIHGNEGFGAAVLTAAGYLS